MQFDVYTMCVIFVMQIVHVLLFGDLVEEAKLCNHSTHILQILQKDRVS